MMSSSKNPLLLSDEYGQQFAPQMYDFSLYCFHFDFRYVTLDIYIYIYIICVPTCKSNNEFVLSILREIKMADFEHRQSEIGLEFVCWSFPERNNFSEGSSEPNKDAQVIRVQGRQPHEFLNSNYLFFSFSLKVKYMAGKLNGPADAVSRNEMNRFFAGADSCLSLNLNPGSAMEFGGNSASRLALCEVEGGLQRFMAAGIATSTVKSYGMGRHHYKDFCRECGLIPYPALEGVLLRFIASLGMPKISRKTIKVYLSAIRHHHVVSGWSFGGCSSRMYLVLQGIKKCNGVPQNSRFPIMADLLPVIKKALQKDIHSFNTVMLWAACNVVFSFLGAACGSPYIVFISTSGM